MRGIFEVKDLVHPEDKVKTLEWEGDDGLCEMWDLYFKNPSLDDIDKVARVIDVTVAWDEIKGVESDNSSSKLSVDRGTTDDEQAAVKQNVFSMLDRFGNSRKDDDEYRNALKCGSLLAYNYWWPLGFVGIRE
jgi:hypothetical protein